MSKARGSNGAPQDCEDEVAPPPDTPRTIKVCPIVFYSEANLLRLPWAVIDSRDSREVSYQSPAPGGRGPVRRWIVRGGPLGLPGPFERRVFRALEWMAAADPILRRNAFANPLKFDPREVCEMVQLSLVRGGPRVIKQAIQRLAGVRILDSGFLRRSAVSDAASVSVFRLLTKTTWPKPSRTASAPPPCDHTVSFEETLVHCLNSRGVTPLDWELWSSVEDPAAQRLVEILGVEFSRPGAASGATFDCAELLRLIPLRSSHDPRAVLDRAHQELIGWKYLERVGWESSGGSLRVVYVPGSAYFGMLGRVRSMGLLAPPGSRLAETIENAKPAAG